MTTRKKQIRLSPELTLPLDLVTQTTAILGLRGSGKTHTARKLVEQALDAGQRIIVVDPTDVWWGLRSSVDGKQEGYPVAIFGGEHGDIEVPHTAGTELGEFLVSDPGSAIISVRHLSKGQALVFVTAIIDRFYHLKGKLKYRTPVMVVCDEASTFVPQRVDGRTARSEGAWSTLVRRGRSCGIGVVLVDQRPQSVNKDVLTQIETMICHKLTAPHDRKALKEWIEAHDTKDREKEFLASLASLRVGSAWVWSPGLGIFKNVQVDKCVTFDSSATPKIGRVIAAPKRVRKVDLELLRDRMCAATEEAASKDPTKLLAEVAKLRRELKRAQGQGSTPGPDFTARHEADVVRLGVLSQTVNELVSTLKTLHDDAKKLAAKADLASSSVVSRSGALTAALKRAESAKEARTDTHGIRDALAIALDPPASKPERKYTADPDDNGQAIGRGAHRMLAVLAAKDPARWTESQWATFACRKKGGGSWQTNRRQLVEAGLVRHSGGLWSITTDGLDRFPENHTPPLDRAGVIASWVQKLGACAGRVLEKLDEYPGGLSKHALADRTGYAVGGGNFGSTITSLIRCGLVEKHEGLLRAAALEPV